jgi:DEAD/DEAH box helicase domain-containing protein
VEETALGSLPPGGLEEGLVGLARLLRHLAPVYLLCDPRDLQEVAQVRSPFTGKPTYFIYERQPGGVGMARRLFELHGELLSAAREVLGRCACEGGCPGCIGPFLREGSAAKVAAAALIARLTDARS